MILNQFDQDEQEAQAPNRHDHPGEVNRTLIDGELVATQVRRIRDLLRCASSRRLRLVHRFN